MIEAVNLIIDFFRSIGYRVVKWIEYMHTLYTVDLTNPAAMYIDCFIDGIK